MPWKMTPEQAEKWARLMALAGLQKAMIEANPARFIEAIAAENARLHRAIEDAIFTLSGAADYDMISDVTAPGFRPQDFKGAELLRQRKASEILSRAVSPAPIDPEATR